MSTVEEKLELLVSWYVRTELLRAEHEENESYPIELDTVILKFLGNILLIFDVIKDKFANFIKNNGKVIERGPENNPKDIGQFVAASTASFSEGIHEFTIKVGDHAASDAIGIISDLNNIHNGTWCRYFPDGYMYYGHGPIIATNKRQKKSKSKPWIRWKSHCQIKVVVDCIQWKVTFFNNGQQSGESVDIVPDKEYHPFLGCQHYDVKYEMVQ